MPYDIGQWCQQQRERGRVPVEAWIPRDDLVQLRIIQAQRGDRSVQPVLREAIAFFLANRSNDA